VNGVENSEQLLKSLGCQYAQGYFFSRPLDATGIAEILASSEGRQYLALH